MDSQRALHGANESAFKDGRATVATLIAFLSNDVSLIQTSRYRFSIQIIDQLLHIVVIVAGSVNHEVL